MLQEEPSDRAEPRPAWRWIPLGAFATFLVWLPLSMAMESVTRHFISAADARSEPVAAGVWLIAGHALAFFAGSVGGGLLVGKLGDGTTRWHAALGGALASLLGWLIAATQGTPGGAVTWALLLVLMIAIGGGGGALGGAVGLRIRGRAAPKSPPGEAL